MTLHTPFWQHIKAMVYQAASQDHSAAGRLLKPSLNFSIASLLLFNDLVIRQHIFVNYSMSVSPLLMLILILSKLERDTPNPCKHFCSFLLSTAYSLAKTRKLNPMCWFEAAPLCNSDRVTIMLILFLWKGFTWAGSAFKGSLGEGVAVKPVTRCSSEQREKMCLNPGYLCNCLTDGGPCQPCRMTARDAETEEAHLSNNIGAAGQAGSSCQSDLNGSSGGVTRERGRNWGWMLSGIICVNILILGCALASGTAYKNVDISTPDLQVFLIILLILTTTWMIYYVFYTAKYEDSVVYKDAHAGPVWLRGKKMLISFLI